MNPIQKVLYHYRADNPGVRSNLFRMLSYGSLAYTGKLLIYAIDQGFEVGPDKGFAEFSHGYDPWFHFKLAHAVKASALAAPIGLLEACVDQFIGKLPLILKINSNNRLTPQDSPYSAITSSCDDALRLGCSGIGFTIYPDVNDAHQMFEELAIIAREAKQKGLAVVVWAYPRVADKEYSIESIAYATHMACLLGAHVIKVKFPNVPEGHSATDYVKHIVRCAFAGKRLVVFSGGTFKNDEHFLGQISNTAQGGAAGSMVGRNFFQRTFADALSLSEKIANIYKSNIQKNEPYED